MWGMVPQLAVGRTPNAAPPKERMWGITCLPCSKEGEDLPDEGTWYCCCHPECNFQCTFRKNVKTTIYSHLLTHGVEKDTSKGRGKAVVDRQQPPASRSTSSVASMPATQDPASASQERPAGGVPQAGSSNPPPPLSQPPPPLSQPLAGAAAGGSRQTPALVASAGRQFGELRPMDKKTTGDTRVSGWTHSQELCRGGARKGAEGKHIR